ncbi:MAG TPA: hypothetical protein GXX23_07455, partial [Firmicutes bacterium]|nr:hypothetical protein [Candidatus Fermentithermobacillaceae bacterium]
TAGRAKDLAVWGSERNRREKRVKMGQSRGAIIIAHKDIRHATEKLICDVDNELKAKAGVKM